MNSPQSTIRNPQSAFTLVELLVVIAVIAILAALVMPVYNQVVKKSVIQRAQAEEKTLETAIGLYHDKYGFYPPCNGQANGSSQGMGFSLTNQLYYELIGTVETNTGNAVLFTTLDGASTLSGSPTPVIMTYFGVGGFMNCTKGSDVDAVHAQTFLAGLKAGQIATNSDGVFVIVTGANSDSIYKPLPGFNTVVGNANPWRYLYPGINNPNSYDLWVQVFIGGKTNLICNWKDQPQYNSPLP